MKYLKAYLKAWWNIFRYASGIWWTAITMAYVFNFKIDHLFGPYLLYVVTLAAVGGVVREHFLSSK